METDLHISTRLKNLLPSLTAEERKQLKANIERDERVTDPILYWHHDKQNVVVDGMNRFDIARRDGIPYRAEPIEIGETYEDEPTLTAGDSEGAGGSLQPAQRPTRRRPQEPRIKVSK
jgi:hypothetical protein